MADLRVIEFANGVHLAIALALLLCVYRFAWVPTFFDAFREEIFALRAELFSRACDGLCAFNHPAYVRLRSLMHVMLTEGQSVTVLSVLLTHVFVGHPPIPPFAELLVDLDAEESARLQDIFERASRAFAKYMFVRSPVGWMLGSSAIAVAVVLVVCTGIHHGLNSMRPRLMSWIRDQSASLSALLALEDDFDDARARDMTPATNSIVAR